MPTGRPTADVLIIGGGVIGLTTAYALACVAPGHAVGPPGFRPRVVVGRGGHHFAGESGTRRDAVRPVAGDRRRRVPSLAAELRERTGFDPGYRCTGGLEFHDADAPVDPDGWTNEGIAWERLGADQVLSVEPAAVGRDAGPAYYLPGMAQVPNPRLVRASWRVWGQWG